MAVYTDVSDDELTRFIGEYDIGQVESCKGIAEGVENSNFLLTTDRGTNYILTLYEKRVNPADLPFFIGLMEHLAAKGINCPTPIHGKDGVALRRLCGKPAAIISFLHGMWPRAIMPYHCRGVGEGLARFHQAGRDFPISRVNNLSLAGWHVLIDVTADRADEIEPGLSEFLRREMAALELSWPRDLPSGICHADLFPDNVFFRGEVLTGMIDFYFACRDFFAYDLAICLNAWCFGLDFIWEPERAQLMIDAYQKIRPLSAAEIASLPILARGAALRFLLTRLYDWLNRSPGALVSPKDPREYLSKLRFHQTVAGPEVYGL